DMALVFPKRRIRYGSIEQENFNGVMWGGEPYYVTKGYEVDTVGNVPFATRLDTLYKYLEKAPEASWEILWVDEMERVDLKLGDILKVTAEDGTTVKEYFIDVQEYEPSSNAYLGAILWTEKPDVLEYEWPGDTIPGFDPTRLNYVVNLPNGSSRVPALQASPEAMNATIDIQRATSLTGGAEERTTTFIVTAEDDTTIFEYTVLFMIDKPADLTQIYTGEPFISEIVLRQTAKNCFLEIMNPQGIPLDLSEYLIITSGGRFPPGLKNPADAVASIVPQNPTSDDWLLRYQKAYVPGYKFAADSTQWKLAPLKLYPDPAVNPMVESGDVFVIAQAHFKDPKVSGDIDQADVIPSPTSWNPWGEEHDNYNLIYQSFEENMVVYLFKIKNDSIFEGSKQLGDINDLELVEIWGSPDDEYFIAGRVLNNTKATKLMRKPHVFEPGKELGAGFGTTEENSDWVMYHSIDEGWTEDRISENIGVHAMDPPTVQISTVASLVYLVDDGFTGALDIQGDFSGTTVADFLDNIMKSDTGQVLTVMSAGVEKAAGDDIAGEDSLMVVSSNGVNTSYYNLVDQPLDDNALIEVKDDYAGSYSVTVDGSTGTITGTGIEWGKPILDVLSALIMPELSTFNIIDQNDHLVALKVINFDTTLVDARLSDSIFFEVVAQNGTSIITYQLKPEAMSSDAFVISSVFLVDQDKVNISLIPEGIGVSTFLDNISAVTGATLTLLDKYGFARSSGILSFDDKLEVVSEDRSNVVVYYLNFLDEQMPDNNEAPTLSVDITSANVLLSETLTLKAAVADDGMPYPTALTVTWEVISGEGVTIVSPNALETDVTFSQVGAVVLQVTVDDGEMSRSEIVNVGVSTPGNTAPTVTVAIASFTVEEGETISVSATAGDDGNPVGSTLTYTWSVITGEEANVTIVSPDQLNTDVTISKAGVYTLQITVTDGELIATEIVVVEVTEITGIAPVLEPALQLYPNPVSGILNLELQNTGEVYSTVKLFNITGQAVFNAKIAKSRLQIDVRDLDAGLYIITVKSGEHVFTERIQIVK
ncbi:MAG: T9SS type A sorting domain-containing protein, partial [Bacteroidetes bacterium]|nr:T9SS type A sorting domain-containing protein [Bacteroidota bacterium]